MSKFTFTESDKEFKASLSNRQFHRVGLFEAKSIEISGASPSEFTIYVFSGVTETQIRLVNYRAKFVFQNNVYILDTTSIGEFKIKSYVNFGMKILTRATGFTIDIFYDVIPS